MSIWFDRFPGYGIKFTPPANWAPFEFIIETAAADYHIKRILYQFDQ